jgi:hypothetical protein
MTQTLKENISAQELPFAPKPQTHHKGEFYNISPGQLKSNAPKLFYSHPNGKIWVGDESSVNKSMTSRNVLFFIDERKVEGEGLLL